MFQFTGTVILNGNTDSSGKPKWTTHTASGSDGASVFIKRVNKFFANNVKGIYKRVGTNPVLATAKFAAAQWGAGIYRLALYIRLSGSQNSLYANDMVYKGRPLYFEFTLDGTETAAQVAAKILAAVNKRQTRFDYKYIAIATASVGSPAVQEVTITGLDEFQMFTTVSIEKYEILAQPCNCMDFCDCEFEEVKVPAVITQPKEGFGTYTNIITDLRLPTLDNLSFFAQNQEERPVPGALYNQYTLYYSKDRGVLGSDAVGDLVTSSTTHVFYVISTAAAAFETALATIGTITNVTN